MSVVLDESGIPIDAGNAAELVIRLRTENERLKAELAEVKKDASRLEFITESCWFVVWRKNPHEPKKYRMICDGEPWGKWYKTAREAIDAAMKGK